jgi:hypothetical protein
MDKIIKIDENEIKKQQNVSENHKNKQLMADTKDGSLVDYSCV